MLCMKTIVRQRTEPPRLAVYAGPPTVEHDIMGRLLPSESRLLSIEAGHGSTHDHAAAML